MSARAETQSAVYVYPASIRLWHWINALAIVVLAISGYFIGSPLPSLGGEASEHFLMGYIRFAHFASAYVFAIGFAARLYLAITGGERAREIFLPPVFNRHWWSEVLFEARWYAFIEREPKKYLGHNPLAMLAMSTMFTLGSVFMIFTGFALYSEGAGKGGVLDALFGWVIPLFGQSQDVHTWHHLGMWVILTFVIIHVYAAIREDIMSRQSIISTMISGWRMFKDDRP